MNCLLWERRFRYSGGKLTWPDLAHPSPKCWERQTIWFPSTVCVCIYSLILCSFQPEDRFLWLWLALLLLIFSWFELTTWEYSATCHVLCQVSATRGITCMSHDLYPRHHMCYVLALQNVCIMMLIITRLIGS